MVERELFACQVAGCNTLWRGSELKRVFPFLHRCPVPGCEGSVRRVTKQEAADLMMGPMRDMAIAMCEQAMREREVERERLEQEKARREAEEAERRTDEAMREAEEADLRAFVALVDECIETPHNPRLAERLFLWLPQLDVVHRKLRDPGEKEFATSVVAAICLQVDRFWPEEIAKLMDCLLPLRFGAYFYPEPGWEIEYCDCGMCAGVLIHRPCQLKDFRMAHAYEVEDGVREVALRGLAKMLDPNCPDQLDALLDTLEQAMICARRLGLSGRGFNVWITPADGSEIDRPAIPGVFYRSADPESEGRAPGELPSFFAVSGRPTSKGIEVSVLRIFVDVDGRRVWHEGSHGISSTFGEYLLELPLLFENRVKL